ncbi:MAG: hypothetical protein JXJ22_17900 [Bacteroidales bacterium]|nr:hypothetical protein [Bacteroidales bacterium]
MKTIQLKRNHNIPDLAMPGNKRLFISSQLALAVGGFILVTTFLYLLINLNQADKIIYFCLPGFCAGISMIVLYAFGIRKLKWQNKSKQNYFRKAVSFHNNTI